MSALLKIISPGLLSSLQDKGRFGFANQGVPRSGAMDSVSLRLANCLVGNSPYEGALEFRLMGPTLMVQEGSVRLGIGAPVKAELISALGDKIEQIRPWQTVTLHEGDRLRLLSLENGATGYISIEGGLALKPALNSVSTYQRANLGGIKGRALQENDVLPCRLQAPTPTLEKIMPLFPQDNTKPLRVILGPQDDYFSHEVIKRFCSETFTVSQDIDRMGIRLSGPKIQPLPHKGSDLISDGLVTGAIQIPGNGHPIILCADCQSVGGYPKIATLISADLHRLGQLNTGQEISFQPVTLDQAQNALIELETSIKNSINSLKNNTLHGHINLQALYQSNLLSAMIDAQDPTHFPGHLKE